MNPFRAAVPLLLSSSSAAIPAPSKPPEALVPGWEISLFAEQPQIVTPVGVAVDAKGRVFVVENNTHLVRPNYTGAKTDRVKILEDTNGDGRADRVSVFAEGFTSALNLAFSPGASLHLVHRNGVVRLDDADGDGVCEKQTTLLSLKTEAVYPHNGLGGIAFSSDGWIYIGSGENFGTVYTATGADGKAITRTPGGANVFRIRPDGSGLETVATGMWNAFALAVDGSGRVFVGDNDPDSRPPCRLLHVTAGADFGYGFQYGRSGLHPFVCWNGELPGTLPMAAGTGEAPTAILDMRLAKGGPAASGGLLITEWGDAAVSLFRLAPKGASVSASRETVIRGDTDFHPACLAAAPDGSIYLTDWADREYSVHGKGRVWRIRAKEPEKTPPSVPLPLSDAEKRMGRLGALSSPLDYLELRSALAESDPFLVSAALHALSGPAFREALLADAENPDASVRLGVLLALRRAEAPDAAPRLRRWLADPDSRVRRMAMIQAAELRDKSLRPLVEQAMEAPGGVPAEDFPLWLAALDLISRDGPSTAATATVANDELVQKLLADPATSPGVKAAVIPMLTNHKAPAVIRTLMALSGDPAPDVRLQAVRALSMVRVKAAASPLLKIARDESGDPLLRLDAVSSLDGQDTPDVPALVSLALSPQGDIAVEAARALRGSLDKPEARKALETLAASDGPAKEQAALALGTPGPRPSTEEEWKAALAAPGSAARGRRVFFSRAALCSSCHTAEGRGVSVGPDLGTIARAADRAKLIDSILHPSREIGPLYVTKTVTKKDGSSVVGIVSAKDGGDALNLVGPGGAVVAVPRAEVAQETDAPVSLMPQGLEAALTPQDFRDLLAYLLERK